MSNIILTESISPTSYMNKILKKITKGRKTIVDKEFTIPKIDEYKKLTEFNYKVKHLKTISKFYKQKMSGNKEELNVRIYNFLRLSSKTHIIQRFWRNFILKKYNEARGPALLKRNICVNETDFFSMEPIKNIPFKQFISYEDGSENQIYGFDILSLFNLYSKGGKSSPSNPYNRNPFPKDVKTNINNILRYGIFFGDKIDIKITDSDEISPEKRLELRVTSLFQDMDDLGNYTNPDWFNSLNRGALIHYLRELADIFGYRAQLSQNTKREICPPIGDPFTGINIHTLPNLSLFQLRNQSLTIMEHMVKRGVNESCQGLGANYVLCALTLVNLEAAETLPWLYQSVAPL